MENFFTFLSSINPLVLLIIGLVGGIMGFWFVKLISGGSSSKKADDILGEEKQEDDEEDEDEEYKKQKLEHKKMSERFDFIYDRENDDYNIGLIIDKKNDCEYLIFYDNFSETTSVVPLKKKGEI